MITIDKVTYRNLQEQVQKNKEDIAAWQNVEFTLNNFGIKVLGKVDSVFDIPIGTYEFGDAYLVGLTDPYDLYIYTRNNEAADSGSFVNVGPLNVIGQEGPQGPAGQNGVDGYAPVVRYGNGLPIAESTDKDGYLYIDQQTSRLYTFQNNMWNYVVNMQGAKGDKGEQGIQGATGTTLSIVARLASPDLLPTNFASGAIPKNSAYLVDVQGANHLYIILGNQSDYSTWYWADAGDFNLGSVLYKDSVFQQYANITDSYDSNTGAVVTDTATNNMNNDLKSQIGDLTTLGTSDKSSLVNAINEVKSGAGGGAVLLWSGEKKLQTFGNVSIGLSKNYNGCSKLIMTFKIQRSNTYVDVMFDLLSRESYQKYKIPFQVREEYDSNYYDYVGSISFGSNSSNELRELNSLVGVYNVLSSMERGTFLSRSSENIYQIYLIRVYGIK